MSADAMRSGISFGRVESGDDLVAFERHLRGLNGERCSMVQLSYGGELDLEFGRLRIGADARIAAGEWSLVLVAAPWRIVRRGEEVASSYSGSELDRAVNDAVESARVVRVTVVPPQLTLTIEFEGGLQLQTEDPAEEDADLPAWELFTPDGAVISVGRDGVWSMRDADASAEPESRQRPPQAGGRRDKRSAATVVRIVVTAGLGVAATASLALAILGRNVDSALAALIGVTALLAAIATGVRGLAR